MKIRHSFVSNSSSSSYLVVGMEKTWKGENAFFDNILNKLLPPVRDSEDDSWYNWIDAKEIDYGVVKLDDVLCAVVGDEPWKAYVIGVNAASRLQTNLRVSDIAQEMANHLESVYKVKADPSQFILLHGECRTG